MKRFIVNILVFFLIVAAIDYAVGKLGDYLQTHAKGGSTRALNDLVLNDCHDVIILGSSRAHHHYDTPFLSDTLGLDVYNAGYDGNGCILAYGLLELILERYRPKLVLFDVSVNFDIIVYDDNFHKRYISLLKPYYKNNVIGDIIKDVSIVEWYKVHSGLFRYNSKLVNLIANYYSKNNNYNSGYGPLTGIYTMGLVSQSNNNYSFDPFKLKYVEKLLLLAKCYDVKIAVISSPYYGKEPSYLFNPIKSICRKHNVPYFNYSDNPYFLNHNDLFKDKGHLNSNGARVFSSIISADINAILLDNP